MTAAADDITVVERIGAIRLFVPDCKPADVEGMEINMFFERKNGGIEITVQEVKNRTFHHTAFIDDETLRNVLTKLGWS